MKTACDVREGTLARGRDSHRRGSINHAWFSPGLMSVLHMCERTSLVEGFLGIEAVSRMWGTLGDMGYSFPKKRTSEI